MDIASESLFPRKGLKEKFVYRWKLLSSPGQGFSGSTQVLATPLHPSQLLQAGCYLGASVLEE